MRRTTLGTLALLAMIGGVLAYGLDAWLQTQGKPIMVPGVPLAPTLAVVAAVLVALAWPIRRYTRRLREERDRQRVARGSAPREHDVDRGADAGRDGRDLEPRDGPRGPEPVRPGRPDPFAAMRIVAFAKASSMAGALLLGGCLAILGFALTRAFVVVDHVVLSGVGAAGSLLLVVVALIVESWCSLPPDDSVRASATMPALD